MKFSLAILVLCLSASRGVFSDDTTDVCDISDNATADDACAMKSSFGGSEFFQQYMPDFQPIGALYVQYGNVVVGGAQQLSPSRIYYQPSLFLSLLSQPANSGPYTCALIDFLSIGGQNKLIWLQPSMVADAESGLLRPRTPAIVPYTSPAPPQGSGIHQYIALIISQSQGLDDQLLGGSSLSGYAGTLDLAALTSQLQSSGAIVAASYFKSQHDGIAIPSAA